MPCMQTYSVSCKRLTSPNQREDNAKPRALLATVGSEGRCSKSGEHNESEPILADNLGNLAKSGNAQNLDKIVCYNGWVSRQDSLLNEGSLYPCNDC